MSSIPAAWLVVAADGYRAVFLDHATADRYAARVHGDTDERTLRFNVLDR